MEKQEFEQLREFCLSLRRNVTSHLDYEYKMAVLIEKCARELRATQHGVEPTSDGQGKIPSYHPVSLEPRPRKK